MNTLLELQDVNAFYGAAHILHGLSLRVDAGERVALIGRNGVGKTTVVNTILGLAQMKGGQIRMGDDLKRGGDKGICRQQGRGFAKLLVAARAAAAEIVVVHTGHVVMHERGAVAAQSL